MKYSIPILFSVAMTAMFPATAQEPSEALTKPASQVQGQAQVDENAIPAMPNGVRREYSNISNGVDSAIRSAESKAKSRKNVLKLNNSTKIVIRPGVNEIIPIARMHANRIVTPFRNPEVISTSLDGGSAADGKCGEICVKGNVVYVSTEKTEAVSMFITEQGSEEQAISITMLPRNIPPREVFLELPAGLTPSSSAANDAVRGNNYEAESFERSLPYVETLRTMLREVALGHIPSGYSLGSTAGARNIPSCKQTDLRFNFKDGQRLTGHNLDIYVGVVRNVGKFPVEFEEASCGSHQTAAVATWPLHVLQPGQSTEVYVVMKEERKVVPDSERPFLIRRNYNFK